MSDVERYKPQPIEEVGEVVKRFVAQGRTVIDAAVRQSASETDLHHWYTNFCADVDDRFGTILYMYGKTAPGIKRDLTLGGRLFEQKENKAYGTRMWITYGSVYYSLMQLRHGGRRGPSIGAELSILPLASHETLGRIRFRDTTPSRLEIDWFRNPYSSVVLDADGVRKYPGMNVAMALGKVISAVETMPGILPQPPDDPPLRSAVEARARELPPAS